eukprot:ctg_77.g37
MKPCCWMSSTRVANGASTSPDSNQAAHVVQTPARQEHGTSSQWPLASTASKMDCPSAQGMSCVCPSYSTRTVNIWSDFAPLLVPYTFVTDDAVPSSSSPKSLALLAANARTRHLAVVHRRAVGCSFLPQQTRPVNLRRTVKGNGTPPMKNAISHGNGHDPAEQPCVSDACAVTGHPTDGRGSRRSAELATRSGAVSGSVRGQRSPRVREAPCAPLHRSRLPASQGHKCSPFREHAAQAQVTPEGADRVLHLAVRAEAVCGLARPEVGAQQSAAQGQ